VGTSHPVYLFRRAAPLDQETVNVNGDGTYSTPTGSDAGPVETIYSWAANYIRDAINNGAVSTCETVEIVPP
jgi:hypothetical protein